MNRQVVKPTSSRSATGGEAGSGDAYMERLLKLIPGETVAMYLFLQGVITSGLSGDDSQLKIWLWGIIVILAVGNILYLRKQQQVSDFTQILILTIAFFIWILSIGGPFVYFSWYQPFMGSVILGLFTFFVPLVYTGPSVGGNA
jgi:hypothetical protein